MITMAGVFDAEKMQCLSGLMSIQERARAAQAVIWMISNVTLSVFVCETAADIQRDKQTQDPNRTKDRFFVLALWSVLDGLLNAIVMFFPDVLGRFCYVRSKLGSCACGACGEFLFFFSPPSSNCVPATNLCLFSVELVNVHGFLFIILAASTAQGLILWTNQTIWSLQSYDVLRRDGMGMLLCRQWCQPWETQTRTTATHVRIKTLKFSLITPFTPH